MLDILAQVCDEGGALRGVRFALFDGGTAFLTAVELRFERATLTIRAVPDDDTVSCSLGAIVPDHEEVVVDAGGQWPWSDCIGLTTGWAWLMTNHQGSTDGVRLEFGEPGRSVIVELLVAASALTLFTSTAVGDRVSAHHRPEVA